LFVSISQVIGCEVRLRNDLFCVWWGVKLASSSFCQNGYVFVFISGFWFVSWVIYAWISWNLLPLWTSVDNFWAWS